MLFTNKRYILLPLSCLINLAWTSRNILNSGDKNDHLSSLSDLKEEKKPNPFTIECIVSCEPFLSGVYYFEVVPFYSQLVVFRMKELNFAKCFF